MSARIDHKTPDFIYLNVEQQVLTEIVMAIFNVSTLVSQAEEQYDGIDYEFLKDSITPLKTTLATHMSEALGQKVAHAELSQIKLEMVPTWGYVNIHLKRFYRGQVKPYILSTNPNCTLVKHVLIGACTGEKDRLAKILSL